MDVRDYIELIRRGWRTVLAVLLVAMSCSALYLLVAPKRFEATASLVLIASDPATIGEAQLGAQAVTSVVGTYAGVIDSAAVIGPASEAVQPRISVAEALSRVSATPRGSTTLIDITANSEDPRQSAALANAVSQSAVEVLPALQGLSRTSAPIALRPVQSATQPTEAISPNARQVLVLGLSVGLILGIAIVIARRSFDDRVRSRADLESSGLQVLATLEPSSPKKLRQVTLRSVNEDSPEAYRFLRTRLGELGHGVNKSLLLSPVKSGPSAARVSINLATSFARTGRSVLLIDGDLRQPLLAELLGVEGTKDLTTLTEGNSPAHLDPEYLAQLKISVIASRNPTLGSPDLFEQPEFETAVRTWEQNFDYVLINGPSVLKYTEAAMISRLVDSTILSTLVGRDRLQDLDDAIAIFGGVSTRPAGIVVIGAAT